MQRERFLLWVPVAAIVGAGAWLAAPRDPPFWLGPLLLMFGAGLCWLVSAWPSARREGGLHALRLISAGVFALISGFGFGLSAATWRAASVAAPVYDSDGPVRVEGWVVAVERSAEHLRLRLLVRELEGAGAGVRFVRVNVPDFGVLTPGRGAVCRVVLSPPSGQLAPGAYDFARRAYFEKLSATGIAYGRCRPADLPAPASRIDRWGLKLAALRADLSAAIQSAAPGRGGAVAAALVAGDMSAVDAPTNDALRNSGLGHLLSVSGVHMAVVGGLVFAALRWLFALMPYVALRAPVKKLAAAGALIALFAYLMVSGSSVPAIRSYVMAAVAFGAILIDRPAISMRGLALAALIIVAMFPESVLEPGFQMSFAATMALVAFFELPRRREGEPDLPSPGILIGTLTGIVRGIGGVIGVSLVAGLATDPFALYHFQRFATYALPANLVVAPIMSFLVAPAAGVAAVLAPFGLADVPLQVMASALDLVVAVGDVFGQRAEAVRAFAKPSDLAMALCVLALLWACLWRGALRWGALLPFAASLALYWTSPLPLVAFDGEARAVFARTETGWTLMRGGGRSTYARDKLASQLGISESEVSRLAAPEGCGDAACMWRAPEGRTFALVQEEAGFEAVCGKARIVVARAAAPEGFAARCSAPHVIDAAELAREGGGMIYARDKGVLIKRARPPDVARAWTVRAAGDEEE